VDLESDYCKRFNSKSKPLRTDENELSRTMNRRIKEALRYLLPRSLRRHRILAGPLRGSVIVTSWHNYPGAILGQTERPLLECFARNVKQGETWLDVGAHYGYTAIALCKLVGASGRVFAFEPMLETAGCLSRGGFLNSFSQLTVVPTALGNCTDVTVETLRSLRGMLGGVFEGHRFSATDFRYQFMSCRLEWLWPRIAGTDLHIDGIKIDVQGTEIQVLEGMASLVERYHPKLLVEIHSGVSRPKLLDIITSLGYSPRGAAIEPIPGELDPIYADDRTYLFTPDLPVSSQPKAAVFRS